jgi:hypothetical protein
VVLAEGLGFEAWSLKQVGPGEAEAAEEVEVGCGGPDALLTHTSLLKERAASPTAKGRKPNDSCFSLTCEALCSR